MTNSYARLRVLFDACVDLPEGERLDWLERNVADDDQRLELEMLLLADSQQQGFLERDVVSRIDRLDADDVESDPATLVGKRFGAFELEELLGRGGQGTVFRARRVDGGFAQAAAVKLLRRGIHDPLEHRRFRREREILARFEHPGVARIIDGGVSGDGVPFLVMEHVNGRPIDEWCESHALAARARLELFVELCGVVAAAHRSLVVHRDIKPSNVLVTEGGEIKVLDFGIARLLDEEESETEVALRMVTPGYGAPEQATGGTITPATDVHALGVLLRVLLTGHSPLSAPARFGLEMPDHVPRDVRWIVGKATSSDPVTRYRDAAELGEDVRRWLESRAVLAHPPTRWYRVRKFADRNRGGLALAGVVALGILASLAVALWQARVAREEARRAEVQMRRAEATKEFLLEVFESAKDRVARTERPSPDELARAAAAQLEADTTLDPRSRADFYGALAEISQSGNEHEQALAYANRGLALLESSGERDTLAHLGVEVVRAHALNRLGRAAEADALLTPRLPLYRELRDEVTAEGIAALAAARIAAGKPAEGVDLMREAVVSAERYDHDAEHALVLRLGHGFALGQAGRVPEAVVVLDDTLRRWRESGVAKDHQYASLLANLGAIKARTGQVDESIALLREAIAVRRTIYEAPHERIADAMHNLANILADRGEHDEAGVLLDESEAMYEARFAPEHPQRIWAATARANLELRRGRAEAALAALRDGATTCEQPPLAGERACMRLYGHLADALLRLGRVDDAALAADAGLARRATVYPTDNPEYLAGLPPRVEVELLRGQAAKAHATLAPALDAVRAGPLAESLAAVGVWRLEAMTLHALGRDDEALVAIEHAIELAARLAPSDARRHAELAAIRASVAAGGR